MGIWGNNKNKLMLMCQVKSYMSDVTRVLSRMLQGIINNKPAGQLNKKCSLCVTNVFQNLKDVLTGMIPEKQEEVKQFRKDFGKTKVGEVTVDMVSLLVPFL